ncbi:YbdD/YjiX family protein [Mycolicibacterium fortuitum]|uniref:YbdD/YjiX family protein n=1 Tax=Mycolicibacterium fortuitum TaxID=1766 RepID=UPI003A837F3E
MGDNHYRRYVAHRERTHPGEPVLSERDYWKMRHRNTEPIQGHVAADRRICRWSGLNLSRPAKLSPIQ